MTVDATKNGSSVTLEITTDATFTAFGSVTIPVTVSDTASPANSGTVNVMKTVNDVAPVAPAGSAFANLANMTVGDFGGNPAIGGGPSIIIPAGGVTDLLGRSISYSVVEPLPSGLSIDPSTGVISGIYDAVVDESFTLTVMASNPISTSISKMFVLTIRNDG